MMEQLLFDSATNKVVGTVDIPDDILQKAAQVEIWMRRNGCTELAGLKLSSAIMRDALCV